MMEIIKLLFWSFVVITWASYGMHILKEYVRVRLDEQK